MFDFVISETDKLAGMEWQTRLQQLKNAAYLTISEYFSLPLSHPSLPIYLISLNVHRYAFRQMVFFISHMCKEDQKEFFEWMYGRCTMIKDEKYKAKLMKPLEYPTHSFSFFLLSFCLLIYLSLICSSSLYQTWQGKTQKDQKTIFLGWIEKDEKHFLMP